jgi:hypothetical protein
MECRTMNAQSSRSFESFIRPDIAAMKPYTPILPFEVLSQRLNRAPDQIVKLDANENPHGPSPKARAALANAAFLNIYPDPDMRSREAPAKLTGCRRMFFRRRRRRIDRSGFARHHHTRGCRDQLSALIWHVSV